MQDLEQFYRKYKNQLLPLVIGFAAFFVFVRIIMPQWDDIGSFRASLDDKNSSILTLKQDISLLNSISDKTVDDNYNLATTALPVEKDVVLIFAELQNAAKKANVKLGGFSIKVGGIYSSEKNSPQNATESVAGVPFLNVSVSASGKSEDLKKYAVILYQSIPLLEINSIDISQGNARYDVNLFYEPILVGPTTTDSVLKPLTAQDNALLKQLDDWGIPTLQ